MSFFPHSSNSDHRLWFQPFFSRMEEQQPSSSNTNNSSNDASSSSSPAQANEEDNNISGQQTQSQVFHLPRGRWGRHSILSYRLNTYISDIVSSSSDVRDDMWSCTIVLLTFCFFASMTLVFGLYGSATLELGPNYSRLIQVNSIFVQSVKAQQVSHSSLGRILYGFHHLPPLDVEINWPETHNVSVQANYHKEWIYYLNKGSTINISYIVKDPSSSSLSLVIAQGEESLVEWIDDPSYPNATLSWNTIYGTGSVQQSITESSIYYIAVGNLNANDVEVYLHFEINALVCNTTTATYKCYLSSNLCTFSLRLFGANAAVLTSPSPEQGTSSDDDWYVQVSYGPRWITYIAGSGAFILMSLFGFSFYIWTRINNGERARLQAGDAGSEQNPLLTQKDDDLSSWGSSYDSISNDEEDLDEWLRLEASRDEKQQKDGESNPPRLCVICCDAPKDCFFLPCGHCAACFTCGSRITEEAGSCPICRRRMKKVRKIFSV